MNVLSKLLSLGLILSLLVAVPAMARECCKKDDSDNKCKLVGSYTGKLTNDSGSEQSITVQFHQDETVTFLINNPGSALSLIPYFGIWKCLGDNCYKFCARTFEDSSTFEGNICFTSNSNCNELNGKGIRFETVVSIKLERVSCE